MNLGQLRSAVSNRVAVPSGGDALAADAAINECINAALTDISGEQRWPWLLTSATPSFAYGVAILPAGVARIRDVTVNGVPVPQASLDDVLAQTRAWVWAEDGANIRFSPTPTTNPTTVIWYYRNEPTLSADADTPLLPDVHHRTVVARASYHLNVRRSDRDRIALDVADYERGLKNMMHGLVRATGPRTIRSAYRNKQAARWT